MTLKRSLGAAALGLLLVVSHANADTMTLTGSGTAGFLPASFNPSGIAAINADGIHAGTPITIFSGTGNAGGLAVSPNTALTFTFMGKEATFTSQLLYGNSLLFSNNAAPGTSSASIIAGGGIVPFSFKVTQGNTTANNGGTIASGLSIAFAKVSDTVFYVFLDDGGNARDSDFDDMVVKIVDPLNPLVAPIATPLPAALPLFATGLGALGLFSWRRKRKATL